MLNSIQNIVGTIGTLLLNRLCERFYERNPGYPMLIVALTYLTIGVISILLFIVTSFGKIPENDEGNDKPDENNDSDKPT